MKYSNIVPARFISRPNRFIANVEIEGQNRIAHVKNTGRCKELLIPGTQVFLQHCESTVRKTAYDLIAVKKGGQVVNIDSQTPNMLFGEWAQKTWPGAQMKREVFYKDSRFDWVIKDGDRIIYTEVKGVTLEENGLALFPDAPTLRGLKHIHGLIDAVQNGHGACLFFVIQMENVTAFSPNRSTQPEFADALRQAEKRGVDIRAFSCKVSPDQLEIYTPVKIIL